MMVDLSDEEMLTLADMIQWGTHTIEASQRAERAVAELRRRRASDLTGSDRSALRIAIRELTERRNNYRARLAHLTERTDPHVREVYERAVAEVEEAIEACGRLGR